MDSKRTWKGGIAKLNQNVSEMSLNDRNGDWEEVTKKNKNKGGVNVTKQWGPQSSAPRAWGQPNISQRVGNPGNNGSGQMPRGRGQQNGYNGGLGRGGNSHVTTMQQKLAPPLQNGWNWAARVGSSQVVEASEKEKEDEPETVTSEEEDVFSDFEDDDLLDEEDEFDESSSSLESKKNHRMFKVFFENLDNLTMDQINDTSRQWHCPACQGGPGSIDWYKGLQPLATHAKTKGSKRVKLHRLFAKVLEEELQIRGTCVVPGEYFGNWEGLKGETKDHAIIWPPIVAIMNTKLTIGDDGKWLGMGNPELLEYFSGYAAQKARHSYGPKGHRGLSVLIFESSAVGYLEAERLHKHFLDQGTGRLAWEQKRLMFNTGGRRQLFGCLATKDDLEEFNQHYQGSQRLKYEIRSYNEMVVSQMKKMSEDNQQLAWFKEKANKEKRHSKALEESLNFMGEKLRKTADENRIVKQRLKMHHQQNQEEMDFQDQFFRDQMKQVEEGINAKENNFEKSLQEERKKVEELPLLASSVEERKLRMEEAERIIRSRNQEVSELELERDELVMLHEQRVEALKKKYQAEFLAYEMEFDASLTQLMEKFAPGSTSRGDDA
ncbi:hypothetical protein V2J09_019809 [Rumex salicifolius]